MKTHNEIPNYIFWSNFSSLGHLIMKYDEPLTIEFCRQRAMKSFPNIPKEAILVTEHFQNQGEYSVYVAIEFKPEVDAFMRDLQSKLDLFRIMNEASRILNRRERDVY